MTSRCSLSASRGSGLQTPAVYIECLRMPHSKQSLVYICSLNYLLPTIYEARFIRLSCFSLYADGGFVLALSLFCLRCGELSFFPCQSWGKSQSSTVVLWLEVGPQRCLFASWAWTDSVRYETITPQRRGPRVANPCYQQPSEQRMWKRL